MFSEDSRSIAGVDASRRLGTGASNANTAMCRRIGRTSAPLLAVAQTATPDAVIQPPLMEWRLPCLAYSIPCLLIWKHEVRFRDCVRCGTGPCWDGRLVESNISTGPRPRPSPDGRLATEHRGRSFQRDGPRTTGTARELCCLATIRSHAGI